MTPSTYKSSDVSLTMKLCPVHFSSVNDKKFYNLQVNDDEIDSISTDSSHDRHLTHAQFVIQDIGESGAIRTPFF